MANGIDENRSSMSGTVRVGSGGNRERMADRRFANQIRDIAQDRGLMGTRRRAAIALATAERNAPRSATAVNRPVVNDSIRLLQEAVNNPRLSGGGRRALITGAAELGGRSDIAEDLTFGRGLRSVRLRPSARSARAVGPVSEDLDPFDEAATALRSIQQRGLNNPMTQGLSRFNEFNPVGGEETFQDDLLNYDLEQF